MEHLITVVSWFVIISSITVSCYSIYKFAYRKGSNEGAYPLNMQFYHRGYKEGYEKGEHEGFVKGINKQRSVSTRNKNKVSRIL